MCVMLMWWLHALVAAISADVALVVHGIQPRSSSLVWYSIFFFGTVLSNHNKIKVETSDQWNEYYLDRCDRLFMSQK